MFYKRLPIVRHLRYAWHSYRFWRWWNDWGHRFGAFPNEADINYLEDIWYGRV